MIRHDDERFETIHTDSVGAAVEDGTPIDFGVDAAPAPTLGEEVKPLREIGSMDEYLRFFGKTLGRKAITELSPLHVPGRDPLPDFDDMLRTPFEPQKHMIAAAIRMMDRVSNGFIVGEMGTGKTLIGMGSVFKHAQRSRNQGGSGGKFRCVVLCPDHLITKWTREIEETIPGAAARRFDAWTDVVTLLDRKNGRRWAKPSGPEFYVPGRNQAKWYPEWLGISDPRRGFDGVTHKTSASGKSVVVDRVPRLDQDDRPVLDAAGEPVMARVTARVHYCPKCGTVARDKKGVPLGAKPLSDTLQTCRGRSLEQVPDPERKAVRPGVMPTLVCRHMIGSSMFITLQELASEPPDLFEYVGGPFVTTGSLDAGVVYPKERTLIAVCKRQKAEGIQTWVYVQMTGKRNVQPRLQALLEAEGLSVGILRSGDIDPKEREDWIARHGRAFDVMISHPQLVSTGLDLFSKAPGGHNYATLVFYETGYNLFTMRQAARRAWRIGRPRDCRVYYLYYKDTMQHRAMRLMSRKMAAAQALEGEFSEDGLAAMAGEDNPQMALAKSLADRIDRADMQRSWTRVASGHKAVRKPVEPGPIDDLTGAAFAAAENVGLEVHRPEPKPGTEANSTFEMPAFDAELVAKMFANLTANGMTLADLAG